MFSTKKILVEVKRLINELVASVNVSFQKIKDNQEVLKTHIQANQSGLDKFKAEIGNNGVFKRLKQLEDDKDGWKKVVGEQKKNSDGYFLNIYRPWYAYCGLDSKPNKEPTLFERIEAMEKFLNVEYKVEEGKKTEGYVVKKLAKKSKKTPF